MSKKIISGIIFPVLLVVYSFLLINQGIVMSDPGYNYANFLYFNKLDSMWKYSTLLSNLFGHCMTYLPLGQTMIGLNIYTGIIKLSIALITYFVLTKVFSMKPGVIFIGELVALGYCWCPTALLYNYISYLLFTLAAIFICVAVKTEKLRYYFLAGICLGVNVFVRLPNIAEVCLIFAVWFYCVIKKIDLKSILRITFVCIGGFASSIVIILGIIAVTFGIKEYFFGVIEILNMPQSASNYSLMEMVRGDIYIYSQNIKWLSIAATVIIPGMILFYLFRKQSRVVRWIAYILINVVLVFIWHKMGLFEFTYYNYRSIENIGVFLLILSGLISAYIMFFGGKDYVKRTVAAISLIIILVSPLGSNNYLFSAFNNLFFVAPFTFSTVYEYLEKTIKNKSDRAYKVIFEPMMLTASFILAFASVQGIAFGATFVFRDGISGEKRTECVNDIDALVGMNTRDENAEQLRDLYKFICDNELINSEVVLYGDIPGIAFSFHMTPAISSTWPDLDSYAVDKFTNELCRIESDESTAELPIIISGINLDNQIEKQKILLDYIDKNGYTVVFENEKYILYQSDMAIITDVQPNTENDVDDSYDEEENLLTDDELSI